MKEINLMNETSKISINKIVFSMIIVLIIVAITGWSKAYVAAEDILQKEEKIVELEKAYPEIYDNLNSVTYDNFMDLINREEDTYFYIGRPSCGDCNDFEPVFIDLITERNMNKKIMYINVHSIRQNEEKWEEFKKIYNVQYTPTIAKFNSGKLVSKVEWTPENGINLEDVEVWIGNNVK